MERCVEAELLDELPTDHPAAQRSRGDLERVNSCMGQVGIMAAALRSCFPSQPPRRMIEIGAGDGRFALGLTRQLVGAWPSLEFTLLDRLNIVSSSTLGEFERWGCRAEILTRDVSDWLEEPLARPYDAMLANLFLHHFSTDTLAKLTMKSAARCRVFVAVEPRRSRRVLCFSRMLGLLGCNYVTRHDAPVSVRAGFNGNELSRLWPEDGSWSLEERAAGWFSRLFIARRIS